MPAKFALGQHPVVQSAIHPSTKLMAFLDVHVVTTLFVWQIHRPSRMPTHFASWETVDSPSCVAG